MTSFNLNGLPSATAVHHNINKSGIDLSFLNSNIDSGYASSNLLTSNSNSLHYISHDANSKSSVSRLNRVDEDVEYNGMIISPLSSPMVTPTTSNIKRMNALHLSSPNFANTNKFIKSPIKRSVGHDITDNLQYTPKKKKLASENCDLQSITKSTNKSVNSIQSQIANNIEYNRNELGFKKSMCSPMSPPIKQLSSCNILREKSLNNLNIPQQKSLSTSTPKFLNDADYCFRTVDSGRKNVPRSSSPRKKKKLLKKFQSFSPISYVRNTEFSNDVDLVKKRLKFLTDNQETNVNTKRLKFARQKALNVEALPTENHKVKVNENNSKLNSLGIIQEECDSSIDVPRHALNTSWANFSADINDENIQIKIDNLINAPILDNGKNNTQNLPPEQQSNSICDILINSNTSSDLSVPSINSYFELLKKTSINFDTKEHDSTDLPPITCSLELFDEQVQKINSNANTVMLQNIKTDFNDENSSNLVPSTFSTPKKQKYNNSEFEKNQILHSKLPLTPPKKHRKALKRLSSSKICLSEKKKIVRTSFAGIERLNILVRLENIRPALDIILNNLSGEDLLKVCMVSKKWKEIVENNYKAKDKKNGYLKQAIPLKENIQKIKSKTLRSKSQRLPFSQSNHLAAQSKTEKHISSPARSPSGFNETQKLLKHLKKDAKLSKCPRCSRSCEILSPSVPHSTISCRKITKSPRKCLFTSTDNVTIKKLRKSSSFPKHADKNFEPKSIRSNSVCLPTNNKTRTENLSLNQNIFDVTSSMFLNIVDNDNSIDTSPVRTSDVGLCKRCGFSFCPKCMFEHKPNHACLELGAYSPKHDDEKPIRISIAASKQSRKNLKRLCN